MGDDSDDTAGGKNWGPMMDWNSHAAGSYPPADRHEGGANMGFCDGHVQWFKYQDIGFRDGVKHPAPPGKDYWHPKGSATSPAAAAPTTTAAAATAPAVAKP